MAPSFDHVIDPIFRAKLELSKARGVFQGWINDYAVYQKDGVTNAYFQNNNTLDPDFTGSEFELYRFADEDA